MIRGGLIRPGRPEDAEAIAGVHVQSWREAYAGLAPAAVLDALDPAQRVAGWRHRLADGTAVFAAEQAGTLVGFGSCGAQRDPTHPWPGQFHTLYVLRHAQRRGLGAALMARMAAALLAQGFAAASLDVVAANLAACAFYAAIGGRDAGAKTVTVDGWTAEDRVYVWDDLHALAGRAAPPGV